jgi:hypothetical protein
MASRYPRALSMSVHTRPRIKLIGPAQDVGHNAKKSLTSWLCLRVVLLFCPASLFGNYTPPPHYTGDARPNGLILLLVKSLLPCLEVAVILILERVPVRIGYCGYLSYGRGLRTVCIDIEELGRYDWKWT